MTELTCAQFHLVSPELAIGIARDRATALAHLERCARCRSETRQLRDIAGALIELAASIQPPDDFETRVLASLELRPT